jgi:methylglyoxal synthase
MILKCIFPLCCGAHRIGSLTSIDENQLQVLIFVSGKPKSAPHERDEKIELARKYAGC